MKKTRNVQPRFPELPPRTTVKGGVWVGEALIDVLGKVIQVWPTREVAFTPSFPPFNDAIASAIRQWEFNPLLVMKGPRRSA